MVSSVTVTPSVLSAEGGTVVFTTSPAVVDVVDEGGVVVLGSLLPPVVVQADAARVRATATITTERKGCRLALMVRPRNRCGGSVRQWTPDRGTAHRRKPQPAGRAARHGGEGS